MGRPIRLGNDNMDPKEFAALVNGKGRGIDGLIAKYGKKAVQAAIKAAKGK